MTVAAHKTEAVLISVPKIVQKMEVNVGGTTIESTRSIKHLEMIIDDS